MISTLRKCCYIYKITTKLLLSKGNNIKLCVSYVKGTMSWEFYRQVLVKAWLSPYLVRWGILGAQKSRQWLYFASKTSHFWPAIKVGINRLQCSWIEWINIPSILENPPYFIYASVEQALEERFLQAVKNEKLNISVVALLLMSPTQWKHGLEGGKKYFTRSYESASFL